MLGERAGRMWCVCVRAWWEALGSRKVILETAEALEAPSESMVAARVLATPGESALCPEARVFLREGPTAPRHRVT